MPRVLSQAENIWDSPFCQLLFWATLHFLSMAVDCNHTDKQLYHVWKSKIPRILGEEKGR